jgi:hypothetical protein
MLDKYQSYDDAFGAVNNPLAGYDGSSDYDNVPNGAFANLVFTDPAGNPLGTASPAYAGAAYDAVNGIPVVNAVVLGSYTVYFKWRSTEPLVLSPFVFADEYEWDTGLFGINNIQLIMNLRSTPERVIRSCRRAGRTLSAIQYNNGATNVFQNSVVNVQFLTPSLDVPLPPKSVVPYMEFPRYITQYQNGTIQPGQTGQIISQTITLPAIPDLLIIYAKPSSYANTEGDYYLPLATSLDNVRNPLSVNFDNFSGLLSSTTTEQLYSMSVKNGLDMDYNQFIGQFHTAGGSYPGRQQGQIVPGVGSILVLKPSQDITLQSGQAPSLVGNFTLQFNLTVKNNTSTDQTPQLYVITANSGFFESIRGSSRIIKGVLSEQDIIAAPLAPPMTRTELDRMVGGLSFGSLGNILSRAVGVAKAVAPHAKAAYDAYKSQSGGDGAGMGAGGMGAGTGAGKSKKSLASRLM